MQENRLGFLLADVHRLLRRRFQERMADFPLTLTQSRALKYLSRNEGTRQVEMAEMLEVKPITLTRLLDQLVDSGLIERRVSPTDRRAFQLYLTVNATPYLAAIEETSQAMTDELLADLDPAQVELLLNTLSSMRSKLTN